MAGAHGTAKRRNPRRVGLTNVRQSAGHRMEPVGKQKGRFKNSLMGENGGTERRLDSTRGKQGGERAVFVKKNSRWPRRTLDEEEQVG